MSEKSEPGEQSETDESASPDTQENHNSETDEDTASGGAPADPDPAHF